MRHKSQAFNHNHVIVVHPQDQKRLQQFFAHELALYNTLVEAFESRTRAFARDVAAITNSQIQLLALLCANELTLVTAESQLLPSNLAYLWKTENTQTLAPWLKNCFDQVLKHKFVIIPETRKRMVESIVEFYRDQATILRDPLHSDTMEIAYKVPATNISKQDLSTKRHVQIPRSSVSIKYDNQQNMSLVRTPLTVNEIQVIGVNLNEKNRWTTMILRQEPGSWIDFHTPWVADFRDTQNKYLIRLLDKSNRQSRSTFQTSKIYS